MDDEPGDESDHGLLTVGQVAQRFGVSVRTLHHYDEIDLLRPLHRTTAGYRCYTRHDLDRLAQIVVYRRLGFGLSEVAALMVEGAEIAVHLRRQRDLVAVRLDELHHLAQALDAALSHVETDHPEATVTDQPLTDAELRELFGDSYDENYPAEAEQRWGRTDAWQQSSRRTSRYGATEWRAVKTEAAALTQTLAATKHAGHASDSAEAMDAVEAHRRHITRWFYDCPTAMHRGLGDMYVADPRFTAHYDDLEPGLAAWTRDAIHANADRQDAPRSEPATG